MSQSTETEIHDSDLKIPKILSIISNNDSLLIKFEFIKQSQQSIDNAKNEGHSHGGHAHKHGDEVVTIRKELQFHEIETVIKYNNTNNNSETIWISLGGFRQINLIQKVHSHSLSHKHCNHNDKECDDNIITLCYPIFEVNQYLQSHNIQWIQNGNNFQIRMRLRYKIAYRVAHLSQQIDSIISCFSDTININSFINNNNNEMKEEKKNMDIDTDIDTKTHKNTCCLSLCSNKLIQIDNLCMNNKTRQYLTQYNTNQSINYPNEWLFYPSMTIGYNISNHIFDKNKDDDYKCDMLFCYDGFNKDNQILYNCFGLNINNGIWYTLPLINNPRSRCGLIYTPNTKQLILCGGYKYDIKNGTQYLNCMEYLNLNLNGNNNKLKWNNGLKMRANRCEHSIGLINNKNNNNNNDMILICGGSNDMFLRSSSILSVSNNNNNVIFEYKRCGLMKESCIKGSLCHDIINNNGDNMYIIGGNNGFGSTRNAQCFNLEKNKWNMMNGTLNEHDDYPCVWIEKNTNSLYYGMIGVIGHSQQLSSVEYYDIRTNKWISHCQFPYFTQGDDKIQLSRMTVWEK